jgi:putative molybdopterin biosynthesis protein
VTGPLLKSADVARLLQVHPKQIYRLLARGLPAHRVGSEWRFSRDEVLAWSGVPAEDRATAPRTPTEVPPLLGANGDLVIEILVARLLAEDKPIVGLVQLDRGEAFERLAKRTILLAGFHGDVPPSHVDAARLARIHLVAREIGLAFPRSSRLRKLRDLAKKRAALRPPTAGVRAHFDRALSKEGLTLAALRCKTSLFESHREAVCAVLCGKADVALTTSAWAERVGLGFLPLATEPYDLLLYAESLGSPVCVAVCEVAQSAAFRRALSKIAGYEPRRAGEIRYER